MTASVIRAHAARLPLPDGSVDLIVTSPPFYALRSYTDGGVHYAGQLGSEPTWQEYIENLLTCTREWIRVLKPTGNLFVELGDKYAQPGKGERNMQGIGGSIVHKVGVQQANRSARNQSYGDIPGKSLMDLPHRYAIRCVDDLGLIKRAEIPWHHVNGLPESVTDRVRRAHSMVFHFTRQPRYYSAVDEIREPHSPLTHGRGTASPRDMRPRNGDGAFAFVESNPLGKLPGSVWSIPSQPLQVPAHVGVDHFAAFPMELPRRLIMGWSPPGVCTGCGQGRRPIVDKTLGPPTWQRVDNGNGPRDQARRAESAKHGGIRYRQEQRGSLYGDITGYVCICGFESSDGALPRNGKPAGRPGAKNSLPLPPTRPAVVLDPFGGTGTTALVASVLGRHGITADLSMDYARLAQWRCTDPGERARALQVPKPPPVADGQEALFPL